MRYRWGALVLALALHGIAGAQALAPVPAQGTDLYLDALRALDEGRTDDATGLLLRVLAEQPQHAGAWLDLAISQCELGNAAEAERLFQAITARFAPPPEIVKLIGHYRARGCKATAAPRHAAAITLARGRGNNVNQGASSRFFSTGSGSSYTQWELAPDYLPQADYYSVLTGDYTRALDANGTLGIVQLRTLLHDTAHVQDTTSLLVGLERPWQAGAWRGRTIAVAGLLRLDNQLYQRQAQLQLRATPPSTLPERVDWSVSAAVNHVQYPTRSAYDASTLDVGTIIGYRGTGNQTQLSIGALSDRGRAGRLGGDRRGWYGGVQWYARLSDRFNAELGWTRQHWLNSTVYSPGLIDSVRRQQTSQLRVAVIFALPPHQSLQLEWRDVRNKENISLFQYNSQVLQMSWRWDGL